MADYSNPETKALYERYMSQGLEQGLSAPAASAIAQRTVEGTLGQLRPGGTQASIWGSGQDQSEARNAALARVAQEAPSSGGFFDQFAKETVRPAPVRRAVARRRIAPRGMDMGFLNNTEADNLELMRMAARTREREERGERERSDRLASQVYGSSPSESLEYALRPSFVPSAAVPADIDISTPSQIYGSAPSPSFLYATREERMRRPETLEVPPTPPLSPRAYVRSMGIDEPGALMEAGVFPQGNMPQMSRDLMDRAAQDARRLRIAQRVYDETEYRKFLEGSQAAAGGGLSGEAEYEQFLADSLAAAGGSPLTSGQQMSRDLFRSMRPGIGRL